MPFAVFVIVTSAAAPTVSLHVETSSGQSQFRIGEAIGLKVRARGRCGRKNPGNRFGRENHFNFRKVSLTIGCISGMMIWNALQMTSASMTMTAAGPF